MISADDVTLFDVSCSSRRSSLPDRVRGRRSRELDRLRHLEPAPAAPRRGSQLARRRARGRRAARRSPPAPRPTPGPGVRGPRRRRPPGCASRTASTSTGATFSPPVMIVSAIAAGDRQPAAFVERAEVAGVQPAVLGHGGRRRRSARARAPPRRRRVRSSTPGQRPAVGHDLRAGLGHAVRRRDGHSRAARRARAAPAGSGLRRAAPSAASAGRAARRRAGAASIVGTSDTSVIRSRRSLEQTGDRLGVEALVQDRGRAVDRAADQDRQAADVRRAASGTATARAGSRPSATAEPSALDEPVAVASAGPRLGAAVVPDVCITVATRRARSVCDARRSRALERRLDDQRPRPPMRRCAPRASAAGRSAPRPPRRAGSRAARHELRARWAAPAPTAVAGRTPRARKRARGAGGRSRELR